MEEEKKRYDKYKPRPLLGFIILAIVLIVVACLIAQSQGVDIIPKKATKTDIKDKWVETEWYNVYYFTPLKNIRGLVLQFKIYDDNNNLLNTITQDIGNVKKDEEYNVVLLQSQINSGTRIEMSVTAGTTSIF